MRILKAALIILTLFLFRVFISCCDCPVETKNHEYTISFFSVYNLDNSGRDPVKSQTNIIPRSAYGIQLDLSLSLISFNKKMFDPFSAAFAVDCFCPPDSQYIARDTISSVTITSVNAFDSRHPADSDVSDLFKIFTYNSYITLQEYINLPERIYVYEKPDYESIKIFLLTPPDSTGQQSFRIDILLSDNRSLTMTTTPAMLE